MLAYIIDKDYGHLTHHLVKRPRLPLIEVNQVQISIGHTF